MSEFINWINDELAKRGWGYNELGRRAGLSSGGVSVVMTGRQNPGFEFCVKIAEALGEPPETVLRLAGLLPPLPAAEGEGISKEELWEIVKNMSVEERRNVFEYARWRLQREREEKRREGDVGEHGTAEGEA